MFSSVCGTITFACILLTSLIIQCVLARKHDDYEKCEKSSSLLSADQLQKSVEDGLFSANLKSHARREENLKNEDPNSPFSLMAKFKQPDHRAFQLSVKSQMQLEITKSLRSQLSLTAEQSILLDTISLPSAIQAHTCLTTPNCDFDSKYRTLDGSCNNPYNPNLGRAFTDYRRLARPAYANGIDAPRAASDGSPLASARNVSLTVFDDLMKPDSDLTLATMQFGQFINHDLQFTVQPSVQCCYPNGSTIPQDLADSSCLPIPISSDDEFFNANGTIRKTCMNFVRSITGPRLDCSLGYADQVNTKTHWLDLSPIYGVDEISSKSLRLFSGGLLNLTFDATNNRYLLPSLPNCASCFFSGDQRVLTHPQLVAMHILWAREHNRVARALTEINPKWEDETIFQEARQILGAQMQHITYYEWLPAQLNEDTLKSYGLTLDTNFKIVEELEKKYNEKVKSGPISNEFAGAALRTGHSTIEGFIKVFDESGNVQDSSYLLSEYFFNAAPIVNDPTFLDGILRNLFFEIQEKIDSNIDNEMWNKLFRGTTITSRQPPVVEPLGFDIVSIDIQRGRDHGIDNYNTYRKRCGLTVFKNFDDLVDFTLPGIPALFAQVYKSIEDVDLYVGLNVELPLPDSNIGPTGSCLLAEQFAALKYMDKFHFENENGPHYFTKEQIAEIRKSSLSRIICDNNDGSIKNIQPNAFKIANPVGNDYASCDKLLAINLTKWKDYNHPIQDYSSYPY